MAGRGAGTDLNQGRQDPVKEKIGAKPRIFYGTYGQARREGGAGGGQNPRGPATFRGPAGPGRAPNVNIVNIIWARDCSIWEGPWRLCPGARICTRWPCLRNLTDYPPRIFYGTYGTSPTTPPRIFYGTYGTSPTTPSPLEYFTEHTEPHRLPPPPRIYSNIIERTWKERGKNVVGQFRKTTGTK